MGTHLRDDNECQNCGHHVEEIYCPHCGQKNTETRQSFGHLIAHFAEDLTHYDGAFWRTIKYLLFRPAYLTRQYLEGRRQFYVPPVKLYIFISFISFIIPSLIPAPERDYEWYSQTQERPAPDISKKEEFNISGIGWEDKGGFFLESPIGYRTVKEMDSIENIKPAELRLSPSERDRAMEVIRLYERNSSFEVGTMFTSKFPPIISKAIFIYMPVFAFWLWLFHNRRRWYFFDHGIFTLHYFSFLTITTAVIVAACKLYLYLQSDVMAYIAFTILCLLWVIQIAYFFSAHRKMYSESGVVSFIKSGALFGINLILMAVLLIVLLNQSYSNLE